MPELHQEARALREHIDAEAATEAELRDVRLRVLEKLEEPRSRLRWALSFAGAAAVAVLAVALWPAGESWFESNDACVAAEDLGVSTDACAAPVVIAVADDRITLEPQTDLVKGRRSLFLARGRATFEVAKRKHDRPFRVQVSDVVIVVVGTRFTVERRDARSGSVSVSQGVVEVQQGGENQRVSAGETFAWPKPPPVEEPEPEPTVGVPPDGIDVPDGVQPKKPDVRIIMDRLFQLRSQRRYDEAVRMLRKASRRRDLSKEQRERLSYEAGNVLRQASRDVEACAHFRAHLKRFPDSPKRADALSACTPAPSEGN